MMLVRQIRRIAGNPRIRMRLRPARDYGRHAAGTTSGSNHIRYVGGGRRAAAHHRRLDHRDRWRRRPSSSTTPSRCSSGPTRPCRARWRKSGATSSRRRSRYWREWVRYLAIPFEWQDAVIRAAITLKLNAFEDTGAIVAAMTTSIPEAPDSGRNWDYRYCWLRDAYFVVNALNRLGATRTMEHYLGYILNIIAGADEGRLQPVYGISGRAVIEEREVDSLPGYRGMGPVRVGNQAYRQVQHDVYGSAILAATHVFFDRRLIRHGDDVLFHRLEALGERAAALFDQPDAGIWELRGAARVHTFSSVMCWAGCDRLARIAAHLGLGGRADYWREPGRAHPPRRLRAGVERRRSAASPRRWTATRSTRACCA